MNDMILYIYVYMYYIGHFVRCGEKVITLPDVLNWWGRFWQEVTTYVNSIHIYIHTYIHTQTYIHYITLHYIHTYIHNIHTYIHTYTHRQTYIHYITLHTYIHYIHTYRYIHTYIYIYIYIYIIHMSYGYQGFTTTGVATLVPATPAEHLSGSNNSMFERQRPCLCWDKSARKLGLTRKWWFNGFKMI